MCLELARLGFVDACFAAETQLDGYMREQDWTQLLGEDVATEHLETGFCNTALLFGRKHRGESVKTGQEQGVKIESPFLALLLARRAEQVGKKKRIFELTAEAYRRQWRRAADSLGMSWMPPPHSLRHTGPSEDATTGRRTLEDIRRRGRWTQPKSVQRYSKPHALIVHKARLPAELLQKGRDLEENFDAALREHIDVICSWHAPLAKTMEERR